MPIGPYDNWDECVNDQIQKGNSEESAKKICGMLEKKARTRVLSEIMLADDIDEIVDKEFEVLKTGEFFDKRYGKFKITEKLLSELEKNFNENVLGIQIALDKGHEPQHGAFAWIKNIRKEGNRLLATFRDFTKDGLKYFKEKIFKYFSVEFAPFEKVINGKITKFNNVLKGIALTNRPVIKNLNPTYLSETLYLNHKKMDTFKILADYVRTSGSITDKDIDMLKKLSEDLENKTEAEEIISGIVKLAEEEEKKEGEEEKKGEEKEEGGEEEGDEEKKEGDDEEEKEGEEEKQLSEMKMKEEYGEMKKQLAEQKKLIDQTTAELRRRQFAEETEEFLLSEKNPVGLIPADKDELVNFFMSLSDGQVNKAKDLFKKIQHVDFNERGSSAVVGSDEKTFEMAVKKYQDDNNVSYAEAVAAVALEMPEKADKLIKN